MHTGRTQQCATILQLPSGKWRVQVRRKQSYVSATFLRHEDARKWATATERSIDLGETPSKPAKTAPSTFAHLVDLHLTDMREVGKAPRRSKQFTLDALKDRFGKTKLKDLTRERLIQFGKDRPLLAGARTSRDLSLPNRTSSAKRTHPGSDGA